MALLRVRGPGLYIIFVFKKMELLVRKIVCFRKMGLNMIFFSSKSARKQRHMAEAFRNDCLDSEGSTGRIL
jgi:hypothetical protein